MTQKIAAEAHYLRIVLSEALRVLHRDKGQDFVDQLVEKSFFAHNVQGQVEGSAADFERYGREAVTRAVNLARANPEPFP